MSHRHCCLLGCKKSAEFIIYGGSDHPEDYTEGCVDHVGALLGTPEWLDVSNQTWRVRILTKEVDALPEEGRAELLKEGSDGD